MMVLIPDHCLSIYFRTDGRNDGHIHGRTRVISIVPLPTSGKITVLS